jgi:predicted Zn-dependent protease
LEVVKLLRITVGMVAILAAATGHAVQLAYEPVALGWSAGEVESAAIDNISAIVRRAERAQQLGCIRHCERLERIFARLAAEARTQSARAEALPWSLTIVQLPDVEALAMPGGQVVVSEAFIDRRTLSDVTLAFVLAHEIAHSILEHERQALTFARMLLPRQVFRSVQDMYVEIDFNFALLKSMEFVMQQGEFEADELGLLLASAAGYAPDRQIEFLEQENAQRAGRAPLVATHPPVLLRLEQLRLRLPLARRLVPATQD